jgi:hypothetical protein
VNLVREARGIDQRQPAALAQADEVNLATEVVDQDVEIGKIAVDREEPHVWSGRAPVSDEQAPRTGGTQCLDKAVTGGKVGNRRAVQRIGRAHQSDRPVA